MSARRALLYVPGDDLHKIQKAATLDVDSICLDLEDGVALNRKIKARETISQALRVMNFGRSECLVRINPITSAYIDDDLQAILPAYPDGFVIPKVSHGDQIKAISDRIGVYEQESHWSGGSIVLIAILETAQGILNLASIAASSSRLVALIFGAEDYAADIGAQRTEAGWEVFHARSSLIAHCAAYHLQAIDMVCTNFRDSQSLLAESIQGARMGFTGKQIIHPDQVQIVQEAFTPSEVEIQQALELINNFNQHQAEGRGAFAVNGVMIDAPTIRTAHSILERARAAGKINEIGVLE